MTDIEADPIVSCNNAGYQTNGKWLVRGVNLALAKGQIVTLIGPNGSGKSTTAKLMLGVHKPTEGSIHQHRSFKTAYVPQKLMLDWSLPLNVDRFMRLTHTPPKNMITEQLEKTGCLDIRYKQLADLSGGELQRVLLARALARQPDFLVLDEPVQGVDLAGELAIYDIIKDLKHSGTCAILLVSHDLHFVMAATDQVICLNGHVCCQGSPASVSENSQYRQLFGERATNALAFYKHDHDHTHLADGRVQHADGSITDHCHEHDGHHHAG